jgi:tetratricopeptide (TPR) repeat protein
MRATAAAAALLVLAAAGSGFGMARLWEEQKRANAALLRAQEARRYERETLLFTVKADQVAARALARMAMATDVQNPAEVMRDEAFCRKALAYYDQTAERYRRDPDMQAIVAAADYRRGSLRMILKEPGAEGAYRRSIDLYRTLVAASPGDASLRSELATACADLIRLLMREGRKSEALDVFPPLLELRRGLADSLPGDDENFVSLTDYQALYATMLQEAGRGGEADRMRQELESIYRRAIELHPQNHFLINNLAWLLAGNSDLAPHDPARAVTLAKQAVALAPASGACWNTLGVAHYRAGDWSAAAKALNESMRLRSGGDPYDWLFLAMAHHRLGDATEARRWLDRSIGWIQTRAPHDPVLIPLRKEALRLLGSGGLALRDERSDEVSCTGSGPSDEGTVHESRVTIVQKGIEPRVDFGGASVDPTDASNTPIIPNSQIGIISGSHHRASRRHPLQVHPQSGYDFASTMKVPVPMKLPVGHNPPHTTLPQGGRVELAPDRGVLRVVEDPVRRD